MAKDIGAELRTVEANEPADPAYSVNNPGSCFRCKSHFYRIHTGIARERNFTHIISGHNFDDKDDFRPGNKAAKNFAVRSPLAEAQLTKQDIRRLSRDLNLPTADVPASACLASRISYSPSNHRASPKANRTG